MKKERLIIYGHGKGGNVEEADRYRPLFPSCDVIGLEYHSTTPWGTKSEITDSVRAYREKYESIVLSEIW